MSFLLSSGLLYHKQRYLGSIPCSKSMARKTYIAPYSPRRRRPASTNQPPKDAYIVFPTFGTRGLHLSISETSNSLFGNKLRVEAYHRRDRQSLEEHQINTCGLQLERWGMPKSQEHADGVPRHSRIKRQEVALIIGLSAYETYGKVSRIRKGRGKVSAFR
jgi:hypothetical protein